MPERPHIRPNRRSQGDFVQSIKSSWQKAVAGIIETGHALLQAKDELEHGEFLDMIEQYLPFKARTAQMLMRIAEHPVLANAQFISHLPPSWGTLYDLTKLPNFKLRELLASGEIRCDLTRKEATALIQAFEDRSNELWSLSGRLKVLIATMKKNPDATGLLAYLNSCRDEDIITSAICKS